ncbi:MAG TPA: ABC transporter ATP-binding protein [Candidatus Dormibacteraeota bacterium]|jgi:peptide/nickel transport system ATP-binding protein|nr:ABC transporter ATP-binding protein [Candidatus Dormibacteraeota bacterium]
MPDAAHTGATPVGSDTLVQVKDLEVRFDTVLGTVRALNGVSFSIGRGRVVGIVGESGSGKTMTGLAIMQLIPKPGQVTAGEILLKADRDKPSRDLLRLDRDSPEMRHIRGDQVGMIFQEPMTSLNPVYTVGNQIEEAILLHQTGNRDEALRGAVDILRRVGMPNPERVVTQYPHELSGGMRQRAMIAMALSCNPDLLVADEPTTALDVTTESQILQLMRDLQADFGMSIMFITHNMGVVAQMCDEVAVMYLGRIVEKATVDDIFYNPKHPYTVALLRSIPRIGRRGGKLEVIEGSVPDPYTTVPGCPFHPRCPARIAGVCDRLVPLETTVDGDGHTVRCHLYPGSTVGAEPGTSGLALNEDGTEVPATGELS